MHAQSIIGYHDDQTHQHLTALGPGVNTTSPDNDGLVFTLTFFFLAFLCFIKRITSLKVFFDNLDVSLSLTLADCKFDRILSLLRPPLCQTLIT